MTANEIKRRFPNCSKAFIEKNSTPARGLQGAQLESGSRVSAAVENARKENSPGRCQVSVVSLRRRLIDPDNLYVKAVVDALRYEGLIADDSAAHIVLNFEQKKVGNEEDECTLVVIAELD